MPLTLKNKTIIITGASRGIGREMAIRFARDGANIVLAAKSDVPNPKLPGTIFTVAEEVKAAGGNALPIKVDVREENEVTKMVESAVSKFGGIDAMINNAGAINLTPTEATPMKRYDLMQGVNTRATFMCSQATIPYLKKSSNAHIINLSPPLTFNAKWYKAHLPYTISKMGMAMCTLGMSEELKEYKIAVNSLWPRTAIATAAINWLMGEEGMKRSRKPAIMADAAYAILTTPSVEMTGKWLLDEELLKSRGVTDFSAYDIDPTQEKWLDLFLD